MKRILLVILAAVMLLSLSGCQEQLRETFESTGLQEPAQAMIDGLLREDYEGCMTLLAPQLHEDFTQEVYFSLRAALEGVEEGYTLTPVHVSAKTSNGVTQTALRFELRSGDRLWQIQAVKTSDAQGLMGFSAAPDVQAGVTGGFSTLAEADPVQWGFLIVAVLEMGFVLWMLIDCCRRKMENKWLWLALILMGNVILSLTLSEGGFRVNFNVGIFLTYTALLRDTAGGILARLFLPVGTVVYALMRRKLTASAE